MENICNTPKAKDNSRIWSLKAFRRKAEARNEMDTPQILTMTPAMLRLR